MEKDVKFFFWNMKLAVDYTDKWFFTATPYPIFIVLVMYLLIVLKIGPYYMKNRQPYDLKNVIFIYNIMQITMSIYFFVQSISLISKYGIFYTKCITDPIERLREFEHFGVAALTYKLFDLIETVFYVLRKKQNQVSFLHLHHHIAVIMGVWLAVKYDRNQHTFLLGAVNTFVHSIMYLYYCLSAIPRMKKYLWWKKYLTMLQLVQFVLFLTYLASSYIISPCPFGTVMKYYVFLNISIFLYQFSKFYVKNYIEEKSKI